MNFKQKLVYMLIGSLFTLAGYFLATLANNQPPNAHAQDNTPKVFDKIVCKELVVVNDKGEHLAKLFGRNGFFGSLNLSCSEDLKGIKGVALGGIPFSHNDSTWISPAGIHLFSSLEDQAALKVHISNTGIININNLFGKRAFQFSAISSGSMSFYNEDGTEVVGIGVNEDGAGVMGTYNKDGKKLVGIGSIKDRPNDGLINIYDFKGNHRSYTAD